MPLVDMPLAELYQYQGRNPRPADFDAYWEDALAEMNAVDPQVELVKADIETTFAECYHLYFTGVRGARVHAKYIQPKHLSDPQPAVLMFHGYSGHSGNWLDKLAYAAQGITVAALDVRGQGGRSQDSSAYTGWTHSGQFVRGLGGDPQNLAFRHIFLDTAQLAKIVMSMAHVDETRVGAYGASQGGALTLACVALEPRVKYAAPVYPFLCDYQRVWEMDLAIDAYEELRRWFRAFDPRHEREAEVFTQLGYIDIQHLAPRIRAEVKMGMGLMDKICPPSSQFAAYNKITAKKSLRLYADFAHEDLPGFSDEVFQWMGTL